MATRKPLYLDANGTPTEMNLSDELPVGLLPELTDLAVPATTLLEGVWPGDIIQFDGNKWRNAPLTFGSPGAAGSVCFYCASPSVHQKSSENDFPVHSLSTTPITTGELAVSVVCPADSEVVLAAWRYDTALGITTLPSGIWSPLIYCSVDDASGITWNTRNIAEIIGSGAITLTTSGSGTTRVATASSGFFASGDAGATWLETPKGLYKITAYTSATQVTIAVPTAYANETVGFTGSRWKVLFATYSIDINGITPTEMPMGWDSVQNNFSIASTSTIGIIDQVSNANGVGNITVTMTYDGGEDLTQHTRLFSTIPTGGAGSGGDPLTTTQMADLTSTHIASLTPATVQALNNTLIASLTSMQVGQLTTTQLQGLTATQLASLPTTAIAGLTSTQMAAITTTAAAGLQGVTAAAGPLTTTQMAGLNSASVAAMTTTFVSALIDTQIASLTPAQISATWAQLATAVNIICTGADATADYNGYRYYIFYNTGTFTIPATASVAGLFDASISSVSVEHAGIGGGGGGGGGQGSGGGGAGGVRRQTTLLTPGTYTVSIGSGGPGGSAGTRSAGTTGTDSIFDSGGSFEIQSKGGGGGGPGVLVGNNHGLTGGSGGGAAGRYDASSSNGIGGAALTSPVIHGYAGGNSTTGTNYYLAGSGGGGGGGIGEGAVLNTRSGKGGLGVQDLADWATALGIANHFAGGGSGGKWAYASGTVGTAVNGGGAGSMGSSTPGSNATVNTGGGGGGGGGDGSGVCANGGAGGKGVWMMRHAI